MEEIPLRQYSCNMLKKIKGGGGGGGRERIHYNKDWLLSSSQTGSVGAIDIDRFHDVVSFGLTD